jgi:hypothetical protein
VKVPASSALNGSAIYLDPSYGIFAMTGNVNMQASPLFKVHSTGNSDLVIRGKASGTPYPCTFWATNGTWADDGYWTIQTTADNPITASKVDYYNPLTIDWKIYSPDMKVHIEAGQTKCPVYVSLKPPTTGDLYHTVVHLACSVPGATTDAGALANTWSFFSGKSVQTWDGQALTYYLYQDESANKTASALLAAHHGDCNAFVGLLNASLQVNGIAADKIGVKSGPSQLGGVENEYFLVKNVDLTTPDINATPPYIYQNASSSPVGISGQNTNNPASKYFEVHYILQCGTLYYDPSYGITATGEANYTSQAIGAWLGAGHLYAKPTDDPQRIVKFIPTSW